jgi:MFS superfamily sulfate permease-like transporter
LEASRWRCSCSGKIFLKNKPVALFVVVGGIWLRDGSVLEARGVKLLGEVPQGLPALGLPAIHWADLNELVPLAFACFLLGAVETAAIGRTFAAKHGGRLDANQEFLALAASNLAAGWAAVSRSAAACRNHSSTKAGARARPCQVPSPPGSFWWWCFSSRTCWLRCPSRY